MVDLSAITTLLTSAQAAIELAKVIRSASLTLEQAEQNLRFAELIVKLADVKAEAAAVRDIVTTQNERIAELERSIDIRSRLEYGEGFYWTRKDNEREGPYCQQCYDDKEKLIRLQTSKRGMWKCYTCKNIYYDASYEPDLPMVIGRRSRFDGY